MVDRVKTTGNVFLGLSIECAQCHSHKYDPISHKEYYEFFAFFNNNADSGKQTRGGNAPPMVDVISKESKPRQYAEAKLKAANEKIAAHRKGVQAAFEKWTVEAAKMWTPNQMNQPDCWLIFRSMNSRTARASTL